MSFPLFSQGTRSPSDWSLISQQIARKGLCLGQTGHNEWYRIIHEANLAVPETRQWLHGLLDARVLKGSPLFLKLKNIPANDQVFADFVRESLRQTTGATGRGDLVELQSCSRARAPGRRFPSARAPAPGRCLGRRGYEILRRGSRADNVACRLPYKT